jgi:hypothetical protein
MDNPYPWYDSFWLARYERAKELIQQARPERLRDFERTLDPLRTRPDFEVQDLSYLFSDMVVEEMSEAIRSLRPTELEFHETPEFGRFVVHDHPVVTELHRTLASPVSKAAGEPVEPSYNFISLYTQAGVCPVHMDSPKAKWTLDLCIRQTQAWPIHLSQVVPWPNPARYARDDWDETIKRSPDHRFTAYSLEPGRAILFSGSSQWHYRDPIPGDEDHSCDLVFFHFVPEGMLAKLKPANWAEVFGIPELAEIE